MISSRRLAQLAKKWLRRATAAGRKRIAFDGGAAAMAPESEGCPTSTVPARKGCFAVYSNDGRRFEVPLAYLKTDVFAELLRMSEDAFGLPGAGPITLPCDAAFADSLISCLRRRSSEDAGRAMLASMALLRQHCSTYINPCSLTNQQMVACGC